MRTCSAVLIVHRTAFDILFGLTFCEISHKLLLRPWTVDNFAEGMNILLEESLEAPERLGSPPRPLDKSPFSVRL